MNYALSAPFCERVFQLARARGYTGQITANSFMKRGFGSKLIEEFLPTVNLTRIVNTSGAYIPGHGTPTVLLFGSNEEPQGQSVPAVLAKRGEPSTPNEPSRGLVWRSIVDHGDKVGFDNDYITVGQVDRDALQKHPWSLGGGGASELKELLEERAASRLDCVIDDVGFSVIVGEDELFMRPQDRAQWAHLPRIPIVIGEEVRDWSLAPAEDLLSPFETNSFELDTNSPLQRELWPWRTILKNRVVSGSTTMEQARKAWFDVRRLSREKHKAPLSITFAFVATHNHFVLDRGGKVFNRSAPIIKLPESATEDDHLALLAYLNSSTACFWMKQIFHDKGSGTDQGKWQSEKAKVAYEFTGTGLESLPVPRLDGVRGLFVAFARRLLELGAERDALVERATRALLEGESIDTVQAEDVRVLETMITIQEEIDWSVYDLFGIEASAGQHLDVFTSARTPLGTRPFEIVLGTSGEVVGIDGHALAIDSSRIKDPHLPAIVKHRTERIRENGELATIEVAHYKRRWAITPKDLAGRVIRFEDKVRHALVHALHDRLEARARDNSECWTWKQVADETDAVLPALAWLLGRAASVIDLKQMIEAQSVPFVAAARYRESGLVRFSEWELLWTAQRAEDDGYPAPTTMPAKYRDEDFASDTIAELRGKLDVPKERFISYPGCESDQDGEPVYGWAGWDHIQRAQALASLYLKRKDGEGWAAPRLTPMLAGLLELIPWVKQWHNEPSAEFGGLKMGDYYEQFLDGECRQHKLTHDDLRAWRPEKKTRAKAKAAKPATGNGEPNAEAKPKKPRAPKKKATVDAPPTPRDAE
ncbi:MAG: BREX-2 system adenine-specific DNA-methyltransferase PglX [Myxococcota bacterium]|nr:BREX-2 system adenine-specific DNA-methyltransferase PglX [Myxococcota bacterium]